MHQHQLGSPQWLRGPLLGRGSTATVSLATAIPTGATFAVKSSELSHSAFLQREQRLLSSIDSPHVISYMGFDLSLENGRTLFNLFLEYVPGGSVYDLINRNGGRGLKECDVRSFTRDILKGLSHLHAIGIAHCDVKGRNVLIAADGSAKLADLGCARWVSGYEATISGTPQFMSPEAARGDEQGTPADIWALGCTVIEMATGRPPWPDVADPVSAVHCIGFSGESPEIPTSVSTEARDFMSWCLETDPRERPTADELLHHPFLAAVQSDPVPAPNWRSPKCVLDQDIWDSLEVDGIHDDEMESESSDRGEQGMTIAAADSPCDRIRQLITDDTSSSSDWCSEEESWIMIRAGVWDDLSAPTVKMNQNPPRSTCSTRECYSVHGYWTNNPLDSIVGSCQYHHDVNLCSVFVSS